MSNSALWDTVWTRTPTSPELVGDFKLADVTVETNNQGGLQALDLVSTAILIALYTNAKLPDEMIGQEGFDETDQHVWHGNTFDIDEGEEELGSRLWELERVPMTIHTCRLAESYAASALQPLVRQKLISSFDINATMDKLVGRIDIHIIAYGATGATLFYADLWPLR